MGSMTEEIFYKIKDDIHDIEKITLTPQQAYILDKFSKDIEFAKFSVFIINALLALNNSSFR